MIAKSTWTPMIADAYANKYGEVAEDFLSLVVIPSLAALEQKGVEIAAQEDQVLAAFHLHDHRQLITKTSMALCLGIQSLWEQQLRDYLCNCPSAGGVTWKIIRKASWGFSPKAPNLNELFSQIRGLPIEGFESYRRLDKLQLLGNVCRHGAGDSAEKLQARYPELWPQAMVEAVQTGGSLLTSLPLGAMQITVDLLRDLVNAVVLFWLDMRIACTEALIPESPTMIEEVARLRAKRNPLMSSQCGC
ncbi:hypothetical protein EQ845_21565 [Pseudomonas putida]|uniref:hypothetical protein n=1 Tax=Pseudomonas putida TaxID=303 RepID=UPI00117B61B2|nr:hypothetical protein [Pseudomonas putida]TRO32001.1 hypothetical protein EQ845_21565 [Pseudomonas putida]